MLSLLFAVITAALPIPRGWVMVPAPDEHRLQCAGSTDREWRVALSGASVTIDRERNRGRNVGPQLPFPVPLPMKGERRVLAVDDGFFVSSDGGEWGGELVWYSKDGKASVKLGADNVRGLVSIGKDDVLVLEGLNHLDVHRGMLRWARHRDGKWKIDRSLALDSGPEAFAAGPDAVYVVTDGWLTRIDNKSVGNERRVQMLQPLHVGLLSPNSMIMDDTGTLWIGMRDFVLRLVPAGGLADGLFDEEWLVRAGCETVTQTGMDCQCSGPLPQAHARTPAP